MAVAVGEMAAVELQKFPAEEICRTLPTAAVRCATSSQRDHAGATGRTPRVRVVASQWERTPLGLSVEDGEAVLRDHHGIELARGLSIGDLEVDVPGPVAVEDATAAMLDYPALDWGERMFPCFVCDPDREDSLGVFPGPIAGRNVVAATWTPAETFGQEERELVTSAVLDCTGTWGAMVHNELETGAFLARMAAKVKRTPAWGETHVAVGWGGPREDRKLPAGAALYDSDGS